MLQSLGSQRVRHDWATELNWTALKPYSSSGVTEFLTWHEPDFSHYQPKASWLAHEYFHRDCNIKTSSEIYGLAYSKSMKIGKEAAAEGDAIEFSRSCVSLTGLCSLFLTVCSGFLYLYTHICRRHLMPGTEDQAMSGKQWRSLV